MIYLDSSVALAFILSEDRRPAISFWQQPMTSSRLLQYEVWNTVQARAETTYRHARARSVLRRVAWQEMTGLVLARALRPFPAPIRTLDGLHLATIDHLRMRGVETTLASYDNRLLATASAMGFGTVEP